MGRKLEKAGHEAKKKPKLSKKEKRMRKHLKKEHGLRGFATEIIFGALS